MYPSERGWHATPMWPCYPLSYQGHAGGDIPGGCNVLFKPFGLFDYKDF